MIRASEDQKHAAKVMMSGRDVFLTGGAGTGKSFVLNAFLNRSGKRFLKTATTGAAATIIHGSTLHSVMGLPTHVHEPGGHIEIKDKTISLLRSVDGISIDEASMLRIDTFQALLDVLERASQKIRKRIQLIMTGDFAQLPPVLTEREAEVLRHYYGDALFAFEHPEWSRFAVCSLTTAHRQGDDLAFARWLGEIRSGRTPDLDLINARVAPGRPEGAVVLVATNDGAARINNDARDDLDGAPEFVFEGFAMGPFPQTDMRVPPRMTLPVGARVIICANDRSGDRAFVNGTTGHLVEKTKDDEAIVDTDAGTRVIVPPTTWDRTEYEPVIENGEVVGYEQEVVAAYTQTPILPGWAITIHRSQGMSLPRVHVDPRRMFVAGQAYVALSRATSLAGLTLEHEMGIEDVIHDERVRAYHAKIL